MGSLREDAKRQPEKVPAGWKTAQQLADSEGLSNSHARRLIYRLVSSGKWEKQCFRIKSGGMIYPVPHYRAKPKNANSAHKE